MGISLDQDLLRTFVAIVDCGSSANAARRLHRTPSGISMQMRKLEDLVGKPIFRKEGRLVCLTATGEALVPYARRIVHLLDHALVQVAGDRVGVEVTFGISDDYISALLPQILSEFAERCPSISVNVKTGSSSRLYEMSRGEKIDLSLVTCRAEWTDVEFVRSERLVWTCAAAGRPWEGKPFPVAMFREGCVRRTLVMDALAHHKDGFRIACTSESHSGLVAAARTGVVVAPMAQCCVPEDLCVLEGEGLPELPMIQLGLVKRPNSTATVSVLASCVMAALNAAAEVPTKEIESV